MNPAEKYMPRKENEDMTFTPFANNSSMSNTMVPYSSFPNQFYNPMQQMCYMLVPCNLNTVSTNYNNTMPYYSNMYQPYSTNQSSQMNNTAPYNSSMNSPNPNYQLDYPDQTDENILPSYNQPQNTAGNNLNTIYGNNNSGSTSNNTTGSTPNINLGNTNTFRNTMLDALREFDLNEDLDILRDDNDNTEMIFKEIEKTNPGTFTLLQAYNVPYPIIKLLIKRVIKFTLSYHQKDGE